MTNDTVATQAVTGGAEQLTVTYKGGERQTLVPPNVPVVMLAPAARRPQAGWRRGRDDDQG